MRQIVLSILVENTPGVLSRISGLFTRRGYNIDSITAVSYTHLDVYKRQTKEKVKKPQLIIMSQRESVHM